MNPMTKEESRDMIHFMHEDKVYYTSIYYKNKYYPNTELYRRTYPNHIVDGDRIVLYKVNPFDIHYVKGKTKYVDLKLKCKKFLINHGIYDKYDIMIAAIQIPTAFVIGQLIGLIINKIMGV